MVRRVLLVTLVLTLAALLTLAIMSAVRSDDHCDSVHMQDAGRGMLVPIPANCHPWPSGQPR
jgi:hypothetical protein